MKGPRQSRSLPEVEKKEERGGREACCWEKGENGPSRVGRREGRARWGGSGVHFTLLPPLHPFLEQLCGQRHYYLLGNICSILG